MTVEYKDSKRIVALSTDFTTPIVWQNMTDGQSASGNVLSKSGANWTADATSTATFSSSVGAKVEFTVSANTSDLFCGFDISTNTDSYNMDYALYCGGGGTINIYANGSQVNATGVSYSTADTLAVNMDSSGTVTFLKNGSVFYTSSTTASGTYRVNAVIYTSGVSLTANYITNKPTDVQDNSILVEKDTARRYWFSEALAPTFEDDFSSDDWTDTGSNIGVNTSTNVLDFNGVTDGSNSASVYDLGAGNVSDTEWICRFKYTLTSWTNPSGATNYIFIGLSDLPQTTASSASQDFIGFQTSRNLNGSIGRELLDTDGAVVLGASGIGMDNPSIGTQWIEIVRTSATQATIKVFSDSTYSTQVGNTTTATVSSGTSGLRYIKVMNRDNASNGGTLIGSIDDVEFYNGVTTITPATWTMQPTYTANYDDTNTWTKTGTKTTVNETVSGKVNWNFSSNYTSAENHVETTPLGFTLDNEKWICDFEFNASAFDNAAENFLVVFQENAGDFISTSGDALACGIYSNKSLRLWKKDSSSHSIYGTGITISLNTDYYARMTRTLATAVKLELFTSEADRTAGTNHVSGSPITYTFSETIQGLDNLTHCGRSDNVGATRTYNVSLDNLKIYNGVSTVN